MDFADRMLKTPYAATPMRPSRHHKYDLLEDGDDAEDSGRSENDIDVMSLLQRLEDSTGRIQGKLGVWMVDACYLTLHGGMASLGEEHASLHQDVLGISHELKATGQQAEGSRVEVHRVLASLSAKVARLMQSQDNGGNLVALQTKVQELKVERADLESAVLTLSNAVTGLMEVAARGPSSGLDQGYLESGFTAYDATINGHWTLSARR